MGRKMGGAVTSSALENTGSTPFSLLPGLEALGPELQEGNDLEALQIYLCILASDFTVEGQPSLEAPLINVTRKPLPQQTKGKKEKTYSNKCHF